MFNDNNDFKLIFKTSLSDKILISEDSILVKFGPNRNGIVTSWLNGGYSEDLSAVFNHNLTQEKIDKYANGGIKEYLEDLSDKFSKQFNLRNNKLSAIVTSAKMKNYSISVEKFKNIEVVTISTGGVNVNAVSAGDSASYYEENGVFELNLIHNENTLNFNDVDESNSKEFNKDIFSKVGTINTIVLINCKLDESALLLTEMVAVEAKSVALRELMVPSRFSEEIATGTGTDGIAIFSNLDSDINLEVAGKHASLAELISKTVIKTTKESIANQVWLTPTYQANALVRLDRFNIDLDDFYNNFIEIKSEVEKKDFIISLVKIYRNPELVGYVSLVIHTVDQFRMGLITKKVANRLCSSILDNQLNKKEWISMKLFVEYFTMTHII